jgi:ribosome biogenesis GTPase
VLEVIKMKNNDLKKLGYFEWIQNIDEVNIKDGFSLARVIEVNKNSYVVSDGQNDMMAELCGKFMFDIIENIDFPTVGDWVEVQILNESTLAIIYSVLPRKTVLKRKESGNRIDFQLIASNIDFGLVVQASNKINFNLLDRYFVMLNESKIIPIVIFSKTDLISPGERIELEKKLLQSKVQYLFISNILDNGIAELSNILLSGKTYCLLGKSGVGKTSLLNNLYNKKNFKVNEVREKDGKGRHTTVKRQLICLNSGSIFIDTPGIRELGTFEVSDGMDQTFEEFSYYAEKCKFRNCTHTNEKGCAVVDAVQTGKILKNRYENYLKLKKETEFYEMSYHEKRKKDKAFGKMLKNYKKYMNK